MSDTAFANTGRTFGHRSPEDTVEYLTRVASSMGALSIGFKLEARQEHPSPLNPSWVPVEEIRWPDGNAYNLYLAWARRTRSVL